MAGKNARKNAIQLEKKRSDIFLSFGGTPMHFWLAECWFWNFGKIEKKFQKIKWHVKVHEKMSIRLEKNKSDIFPPLGVPLCA